MKSAVKPDLFSYVDYRRYLKDFYEANKKHSPSFSYRYFAAKAGIRSYNYLFLVFEGKRRLSPKFFPQFCKGLGLSVAEQSYFDLLVQLDGNKNSEEKAELLKKILKARPKSDIYRADEGKLRVCEEWYYFPLLELTETAGFRADPKWVADRLGLSVPIAKAAIRNLVRWGLLEDKEGTLRKAHCLFDTVDEASRFLIRSFHQKNLRRAADEIFQQELEEREFGSQTFSASPEQIGEIKKRLKNFRKEIFEYLDQPPLSPAEEVYQLNFQFFRITQKKRNRKIKGERNEKTDLVAMHDPGLAASCPSSGDGPGQSPDHPGEARSAASQNHPA